jgi:hypothetical protein
MQALSFLTIHSHLKIYQLKITSCPIIQCVEGERPNYAIIKSGYHTIGYNLVNLTDVCQVREQCGHYQEISFSMIAGLIHDETFICEQKSNTTIDNGR